MSQREDDYGKYDEFKIEVFPDKCQDEGCAGYHYFVMGFYVPNDTTKESFWCNTGVCGIEASPIEAFTVAHNRFVEHFGQQ